MARPETLVPGNCYFQIYFTHRDAMVPLIMTLVYVRSGVSADGTPGWLFRDYSQVLDAEDDEVQAAPEIDAAPETDAEAEPPSAAYSYLMVEERQLHSVLDFAGLARSLKEIARFHPLHPIPEAVVEPPTEVEFMPIAAAVERALHDPDCLGVTMTLRFTDDGVSVKRHADGCCLTFWSYSIFDPDEEARIRTLFAALGQSPATDRLLNLGRTRILEYTMAPDRDAIVARCRQVFEEVHRIRKGDVIQCDVLTKADIERTRAES
jgi:hypothetical protein